jgi:lipopolysaccharide exporter
MLTRILAPEVFGVIGILMSVATIIELIADLGIWAVMIRHERGDEQTFINTMWTIRLVRNVINFSLMFLCAPLIAKLYSTPALADALRIFSCTFLITTCESMTYFIAARHKKYRIAIYADLFCLLVTTPFIITYSQYSADFHGILYGILLQRTMMTLISHFFYRTNRPWFQMDSDARRDLFSLSKYMIPAGILSLMLSQFDRLVFLRLFDLRLLGIYGVAGSVSGPVSGLVDQIYRGVLYPRCADYVRTDRQGAHIRFYRENTKLFFLVLALPPLIAGAADFIVQLLYDERYAFAGVILQAFLGRTILNSLVGSADAFLVAAGHSRIGMVGNILRLCWLIPGCLLGNYMFGFKGFLYMAMLEPVPALIYMWHLQFKEGMMIVKYEVLKFALIGSLFAVSWIASNHISGLALRQFFKSLF